MKQEVLNRKELRGTIANYKESVRLITDLSDSLPEVTITETLGYPRTIKKVTIKFAASREIAEAINFNIGEVKSNGVDWILTLSN